VRCKVCDGPTTRTPAGGYLCTACNTVRPPFTPPPQPKPFVVYSVLTRSRNRIHEVAERDGWDCHLCREPIDPDLHAVSEHAVQHPMEATLDHVIPRSEGGTRNIENLRLAHRCCNMQRGADPIEESASRPSHIETARAGC
jgi:hypothetical protein